MQARNPGRPRFLSSRHSAPLSPREAPWILSACKHRRHATSSSSSTLRAPQCTRLGSAPHAQPRGSRGAGARLAFLPCSAHRGLPALPAAKCRWQRRWGTGDARVSPSRSPRLSSTGRRTMETRIGQSGQMCLRAWRRTTLPREHPFSPPVYAHPQRGCMKAALAVQAVSDEHPSEAGCDAKSLLSSHVTMGARPSSPSWLRCQVTAVQSRNHAARCIKESSLEQQCKVGAPCFH